MSLSNSRVLLTGGAGFIGSALLWELNRRGCERVVVSDRLDRSEKWRNLSALRFEDYVEADDLLAGLERGALSDFDLVLHLGACTSTTETDAAFLIRNNYEFIRQLAIWADTAGARFVYASSAATYGDGSAGMSDHDPSPDALSRLRPLNAYGYSKHLFDLWAARTGLLERIVGLKYFNVFGPNEGHKLDMRSLVAKAVPQVLETGRLRLFRSHRDDYRDGEQLRDFLYVKDAVAMTIHLAERTDAGGIYNIGSGSASTWLQVAHALFAALERPELIDFVDMPEEIRDNYQYFTQADISRLRGSGYGAPVTPLTEAVEDYVRNYLLPGRHLEVAAD
jgi:ADP-L-glycero-D-manno-heptose 6-epimerase